MHASTQARYSANLLRVLLVSTLPPPNGGIERWTVLLLRWLQSKPGQIVRTVDTSTRYWRPVWNMSLWRRLAACALQGPWDAGRVGLKILIFRPHVLHLNTSGQLRGPWDTAVLGLAKLARVRTVYHIHMGRLPAVMARKGWEWWGLRWAIKLADRVLVLDTQSETAVRAFVPSERVSRLPNAIETSQTQINCQAPTERSVLYLGHVIPTKGLKELMLAWREAAQKDWKLRIAGPCSHSYRKELQGIVGSKVRTEFMGDLSPDAAWECMQCADIFVLPTWTEGFPNVILEAMAAGKAIISTAVGAIPEILDANSDRPCGLVLEPRDPAVLAEALRIVLTNAELRDTLGRRALAKVRRLYTTDTVFSKLVDLWNDIAGTGARSTSSKPFMPHGAVRHVG